MSALLGTIYVRLGSEARLVSMVPVSLPAWVVSVFERTADGLRYPPREGASDRDIVGRTSAVVAWAHVLTRPRPSAQDGQNEEESEWEAEILPMVVEEGEAVVAAGPWNCGVVLDPDEANTFARRAWFDGRVGIEKSKESP